LGQRQTHLEPQFVSVLDVAYDFMLETHVHPPHIFGSFMLSSVARPKLRFRTSMPVKSSRVFGGLRADGDAGSCRSCKACSSFCRPCLDDVQFRQVEADLPDCAWNTTGGRLRSRKAALAAGPLQPGGIERRPKQGRQNEPASLAGPQDPASPSARKPPKTRLDFTGIDVLNLSFGRATLLSMNEPKNVRRVDVSLKHEIIRDIKNGDELWFKVSLALAQNGGSEVLKIISPKSNAAPGIAGRDLNKRSCTALSGTARLFMALKYRAIEFV